MISKLKALKNHPGFIKYFKNTSWLLGEKVLRIIFGFAVGIWVARYLGPAKFGIINYAQSFVFLFSAFSTLGLNNIIVRELIKDINKRDALLGTGFWLSFFGSFLSFLLLATTLQFIKNSKLTNQIILIVALGGFFKSFDVITYYFMSRVQGKLITLASIVGLLIVSLIKTTFILVKAPLVAFAIAIVLDNLMLAVGLIYYYLKSRLSIRKWFFNKTLAFGLLKDSWPLIISGLAISVYMKIDQVMIANMLNNTAVGYYSVAVKFSEIWLFITVAVTTSLFPAIMNAKKESPKLYSNRIINLYRILIFISLIISIFIFLLAKYIILYTYGIQYEQSIPLLRLYVWSIFFVFLNNGAWQWYIAENLQHLATIRLVIGAFINVILNLFLIKYFGLKGAVYATLLSYSIATYFGNLIFRQTRVNFKLQTIAIFTFYKIKGWR